MSEAKHTQGKAIPAVSSVSQIGPCYAVGMQDTKVVIAITGKFDKPDSDISEANARRIAACWNACEGIDTGMLENITTLGDTLASRFMMRDKVERDLSAQRDELLEALLVAHKRITEDRASYVWGAELPDGSMDAKDAAILHEAYDSKLAQIEAAIAKATGQEEGQ